MAKYKNNESGKRKYIANSTITIIEEKIIPFLNKKEMKTMQFSNTIHKLAVFYIERNGL